MDGGFGVEGRNWITQLVQMWEETETLYLPQTDRRETEHLYCNSGEKHNIPFETYSQNEGLIWMSCSPLPVGRGSAYNSDGGPPISPEIVCKPSVAQKEWNRWLHLL